LRRAGERKTLFADEQQAHGERLVVLDLDVTDAGARAAAVARVGGRLDCLVNNAGYALFGALEDTSEDELRAQLEVNLFGAALLTRDLLPALRGATGSIINVSSVFGYAGFPLTSAYCASKYALEGFSEALWLELRPHGVRVHLVEPGGHRTGFASNVEWASGSSPTYAVATAAYRAFKDRLEKKEGNSPAGVVRKIVELADVPSSRLRVPVGADAHATAWLKRLPQGIALAAWDGMVGRIFAGATA
jgi:NAD(P)-dependent dehydrogenase (short-subunit alcohol dehydrogenase family)